MYYTKNTRYIYIVTTTTTIKMNNSYPPPPPPNMMQNLFPGMNKPSAMQMGLPMNNPPSQTNLGHYQEAKADTTVMSEKIPGVAIQGESWEYEYPKVGGKVTASDSSHLEVHPVAKYKTEVAYTVGSLLAANSKFICYALKSDKGIRVIDRRNPSVRALLKGHTATVLDIRLFCNQNVEEEYLALTSKDGSIFVWKLLSKGDNIECENIFKLYHPLAGGNGAVFRKLAWHPSNQNILATVEGRYLLCFNYNDINADGIETGDENSLKNAGVTVIDGHIAPIGDLKWSSDGTQIVTASDDGKVKIWDVNTQTSLYEFEPDDGRPVSSVHIVPNKNTGRHSAMDAALITGCERDGIISIWSSANNGGNLLQSVTILAGPPAYEASGSGALFTQVYNNALYDELTRLLFVCSTRRPNRDDGDEESADLSAALLVLHFNDSTLQFDRLTEFECQMPVVSMTLPATYEGVAGVEEEHRLYQRTLFCVQSKAVQQYQIWPHECYMPSNEQPLPPQQQQQEQVPNVQVNDYDGGQQDTNPALLSPTAMLESSSNQQQQQQVQEEPQGQQHQQQQQQGQSIPIDTLFLNAKKEQEKMEEEGKELNATTTADINTSQMTEEIVNSLNAEIPNQLANTFRDSFKNVLLPAFDRACKEMFSQVRSEMKKSMDVDKKREKKLEAQVSQLTSQVKSLTKTVESLKGMVANIGSTQATAKASKSDNNKNGVAAKKVAPTPKEKAIAAYEKKDYQTAFWTVLSAANLSLVEWLCEYVKENPDEVVSKLTQMVILSLAQQLGSNLKSKTKLKLAWIKAACLSLNTQDDNIRKHIPKVLGNVQDSLQKHYSILKIDTNSQHPLRTEYVMVTHLVKSLSMTT